MSPEDLAFVRTIMAPLVAHRIVSGLSRREVARRMGISYKDVRNLERCRTDVRMSTLRRYAMSVDVAIEWRIVPISRGRHCAGG